MIGLRKTEIVVTWFWYLTVVLASFFVQFGQVSPFWKNYNLWIFLALNLVAIPACVLFKENFADKQRIRRYSKWPLMLSDSKHAVLVNFDIMAVFVVTIVDMFLYIRADAATYQWMMNLIFVIAVILFFLSYFDRKYGPKEMTRAEKLAERKKKREAREAQLAAAAAEGNTAVIEKPASSSANRKKKKYQTKKKK